MPDGRSFWFPSRKNLVGAMAAWKLPEIDLNWPRLQRVWFSTNVRFRGWSGHSKDQCLPLTLADIWLSNPRSFRTAEVGDFYAKRRSQIDLVILLLHQDLTNLLRHRIFSKRFTLPH